MLVQFSILDNSYGCQLEFNFAQGFKDLADGEESNQLDIWTTDRVIRPDDDWACAPGRTSLFGTALLSEGVRRVVINACECKPVLSFRISMASSVEGRNVSFAHTIQSGLRLVRSCEVVGGRRTLTR